MCYVNIIDRIFPLTPPPDLLPFMKRLENYQKPCNNDTHGYDGPVAISNGGRITDLAHDFLRASDAIGVPYSGAYIYDPYYDKNESNFCINFL